MLRFSWRFFRRFRKLKNIVRKRNIRDEKIIPRMDCNARKCKMLNWRKRSILWYRYVHNINSVNDKISNSEEEKTSLLRRSQNSMAVLQRATEKPAGSIFIFNFTMASELELMAAYIIWVVVVIRFPGKKSRKSTECVERTPAHNTLLCSAVCWQARNASHALGSRVASHLCAPEKNLSSGLDMSSFVALSLAVHLENVIFLIHASFYHDTRTTQHHRDNMIISKNTQYVMHISMLFQSTSSAIKNHSGVKTCRVAETRARQHPQFEWNIFPVYTILDWTCFAGSKRRRRRTECSLNQDRIIFMSM